MSIIAVAKDQAGDLVRRRYLIAILLVCVGIVGLWIGYLVLMRHFADTAANTPGPSGRKMDAVEARAMMEFMMSALQASLHGLVTFIGTLLAVFLMSFSVRSEIARGTVRMVLSRPVKRYEFLLGKWLGCTSIVFLYSLLMGILVIIYTYFAFGQVTAIVPISLTFGFLKSIMVGSVGMALSIVMHPLLSAVFAYFAGAEVFLFISSILKGIAGQIVRIPFYILPSYGALDVYKSIMTGTSVDSLYLIYRVAYALLHSALMLAIACLLFRRRDLV